MILRIPAVATISTGLAFASRTLALWSWLLVAVFGAVIRRHRHARERLGESSTPA